MDDENTKNWSCKKRQKRFKANLQNPESINRTKKWTVNFITRRIKIQSQYIQKSQLLL